MGHIQGDGIANEREQDRGTAKRANLSIIEWTYWPANCYKDGPFGRLIKDISKVPLVKKTSLYKKEQAHIYMKTMECVH